MTTSSVLVYEKIKDKIGEEGARLLIEFVEEGIRKDVASKEDMANLRTELKTDIANVKADILKWMFGMWITLIIAMGIFKLL